MTVQDPRQGLSVPAAYGAVPNTMRATLEALDRSGSARDVAERLGWPLGSSEGVLALLRAHGHAVEVDGRWSRTDAGTGVLALMAVVA